jgi:hypothetical protein
MKCPAEVYSASPRPYKGVPELTYPLHDRDLDHRFPENCHNGGFNRGYWTPISVALLIREQDGRSWQRGGGRLSGCGQMVMFN